MTVREALAEGAAFLDSPAIDTPILDASLLLGSVLGTDRAGLLLRDSLPLDTEDRRRFHSLLERRMSGECVAYILGRREFRGLDFHLSPAALVPRPDTETLVEAAGEWIDRRGGEGLRVWDLGTGSGAVAVALKHERPGVELWASDLSPQALEVAARNAARLLGPEALYLGLGDLFSARFPRPATGGFDLIVSNPPYVPTGVLATLAPEVRREPSMALDGGADGLVLIRRIIREARPCLRPGAGLILEADPGQMEAVSLLLAEAGYGAFRRYRDLGDRERVIAGVYGYSDAPRGTDG